MVLNILRFKIGHHTIEVQQPGALHKITYWTVNGIYNGARFLNPMSRDRALKYN